MRSTRGKESWNVCLIASRYIFVSYLSLASFRVLVWQDRLNHLMSSKTMTVLQFLDELGKVCLIACQQFIISFVVCDGALLALN